MIYVGHIISTMRTFITATLSMLSTVWGYHDTCVGYVPFPHICHDIAHGTEHSSYY